MPVMVWGMTSNRLLHIMRGTEKDALPLRPNSHRYMKELLLRYFPATPAFISNF
jgi:hypothetical protein